MYKTDMHVHTSEVSSCGKVPAEEVVRLYKKAGYSTLVITDHFYKDYFDNLSPSNWADKIDRYLTGYKKAAEIGKCCGITVLLGIELRFTENNNDYLIYGIDDKFLRANEALYSLDLKEFKKLTKNLDILVYQAHPYRQGLITACPKLLDGVEVFNGNPRHDSQNGKAYEFAKSNKLKMISGSDFHQPQDLARGGLATIQPINSAEELIQILKNDSYSELLSCPE